MKNIARVVCYFCCVLASALFVIPCYGGQGNASSTQGSELKGESATVHLINNYQDPGTKSSASMSLTDKISIAAAIVALLSATVAIVAWRTDRLNRAAEVILQLEERFNTAEIQAARDVIEDDADFGNIAPVLQWYTGTIPRGALSPTPQQERLVTSLDHLLRFYVVLLGIRAAQQVPDASLRLCYAYWLNHYWKPENNAGRGRVEFQAYVNRYFPNLKKWMLCDQQLSMKKRFFRTWP